MPRFSPRSSGRSVVLKVTRQEREATKKLRGRLTKRFAKRFAELVRTFRLDAFSELRRQTVTQGAIGVPENSERAFELAVELEYSDLIAEAITHGAVAPYEKIILDAAGEEVLDAARYSMLTNAWEYLNFPFPGTRRINLTGIDNLKEFRDFLLQYDFDTIPERSTRGFHRSARNQIRDTIRYTLGQDFDQVEAARRIAQNVGLTAPQARSLIRFEERLVRSRIPNAEADTQIVRELIQQEVERKRERMILRRAEIISEHETQDAMSYGQWAYWDQAVGENPLLAEKLTKRWQTVRDDRVCPICEPLHSELRRYEEPFVSGEFFGQRPPAHVICRCFVEYKLNDPIEPVNVPRSSVPRYVGLVAVFGAAAGLTAAAIRRRAQAAAQAPGLPIPTIDI